MKKFFLYGSLVIIAVIAFLGFTSPKEASVKRSVVIEKPIGEVFSYLVSLQNMEDYSPWQAKDPNTKNEYKGSGDTVGSVHRWVSEHKEVGTGEQEIKSIKINEEIISELRFEEPFESISEGFFKFKLITNGTQVTWGYNGKFGFIESIIMRFIDMDKVLGTEFEQGLNKAKSILEN